jgi:hypothetical protein
LGRIWPRKQQIEFLSKLPLYILYIFQIYTIVRITNYITEAKHIGSIKHQYKLDKTVKGHNPPRRMREIADKGNGVKLIGYIRFLAIFFKFVDVQ